jgi:diketogulonate reductase-like aldo/keto reductase
MNIPTKKLGSGFELPVYGLGIWQMGGRWEADRSKDDQEIAAIRAAIDAGITHIDTAESYGDGHAEELLSRAIEGYDRKKLIIATKVSAQHQGYGGVRKAFRASLKRMKIEYVDLYLLHRYPESGLDIEGTMKAMNELVDEGVVKYIGVCNMSPNRFNEAQKHSKHKLVCNQVHYNVQYREVEDKGVLAQAQASDIMVVAWRPVQKGELQDSELVRELAAKYGKTPTQIAINWLISQDNVVTISKTSNVEHLKENLGALNWTMEPVDIERIRKEYPNQRMVSDAVPLDYEADIAA